MSEFKSDYIYDCKDAIADRDRVIKQMDAELTVLRELATAAANLLLQNMKYDGEDVCCEISADHIIAISDALKKARAVGYSPTD